MTQLTRILLISLLLLILVVIRAVGNDLFYDPLISFFKHDHLNMDLPKLEWGRFYLFLTLRFWLNSLISIAIIYLIFPKLKILGFSAKVYLLAFLILILAFYIMYSYSEVGYYRPLFYIRRFLIHPVLLLLLIPAFYHKQITNGAPTLFSKK